MVEPKTKQKTPRYMDFIGRKPSANADPLASRPDSRPAVKPKFVVKKVSSVADQIPPKGAHSASKKPIAKSEEAKPTPKKTASSNSVPVEKRAEKPLISREPAKSRDLYNEATDPNKSVPKPAEKSEPKAKGNDSAPDNNAYSLSGKSPFLANYNVDKRPLSSSVPAKKKDDNFEKLSFLGVNETKESGRRKNVYKRNDDSNDEKDEKKNKTVRIIDDETEGNGMPIWLIIILTILLGAAVGAGVYFLLPK